MSSPDAYLAFEDRFRGSEALVRDRLEQYAPLLEAFRPHAAAAAAPVWALDLGCGRGEWLDCCRAHQWLAEGVDGNVAMVDHCRARGHAVRVADGLEALRLHPAGSLACISAFHLIEHLSHPQLEELLCLSQSRLDPQGLLILETPNCETVRVACADFHLDPSHTTRIHRHYLEHRLQAVGFELVLTVGLNGRSRQEDWRNPSLRNALESGAPDLAIVASPSPSPKQRQALQGWAEAHQCWSGVEIGDRFEERIRSLEQRLAQQERQLALLQEQAQAKLPSGAKSSWRQRIRRLGGGRGGADGS